MVYKLMYITVNSEIFAMVLFLQNPVFYAEQALHRNNTDTDNNTDTSHMGSCVKKQSSQNGEITLSFTDIGTPCPSREFLTPQICLLTLFAKKKILTKISGYTVCYEAHNNVSYIRQKLCIFMLKEFFV